MFFGIGRSRDWASVTAVQKGWSDDRKYRVVTNAGENLLLRLSDIGQYEKKKKEFAVIGKYAALGFPMSAPVDFGVCAGGDAVYMLLTWVEGTDLEDVLPGLPEKEQYLLGRKAGTILRQIHSLPVDGNDLPAADRRAKKLLQLARYEESRVRLPEDEGIIRYVKDRIGLIGRGRPVYQHGDFHPGNLIYQPDGSIGVIDFNRWDVGDPCEEFYKLESFGRELSIPYSIGQIDAYFRGDVPGAFWETLAVYVAHAALYSVKWAEKFGQAEIDGMVKRYETAMEDYDGFRLTVPRWYSADFGRQWA